MRLVTKLVVDKATDDRILKHMETITKAIKFGDLPSTSLEATQQACRDIDNAQQALLTEVHHLIQQAYKMGAEQ